MIRFLELVPKWLRRHFFIRVPTIEIGLPDSTVLHLFDSFATSDSRYFEVAYLSLDCLCDPWAFALRLTNGKVVMIRAHSKLDQVVLAGVACHYGHHSNDDPTKLLSDIRKVSPSFIKLRPITSSVSWQRA
jgi:hypothetical protein